MNQAIKLFIEGDSKHKRTVAIIQDLLDGELHKAEIARKHGVVRQVVSNIEQKYIK